MKSTQRIIILSCLTCLYFVAVPGSQAQKSWNVAGPASWFTAGNWNPSGAPTAATNAFINNAGTANVGNPGAVANNVTLGDLTGTSGILNVQSNGTLTV